MPTVATTVIPIPGSANNTAFGNTTNPNSQSYGGVNTCVAVTAIGASAPVMPVQFAVRCAKPKEFPKEFKDGKDQRKESWKELKERRKELKDLREKPFQREKPFREKRPEKPIIDKSGRLEKPPQTEGGFDWRREWRASVAPEDDVEAAIAELEARIAALEAVVGAGSEPFIEESLRPDLTMSAFADEEEASGALEDKRSYDSKPPEE